MKSIYITWDPTVVFYERIICNILLLPFPKHLSMKQNIIIILSCFKKTYNFQYYFTSVIEMHQKHTWLCNKTSNIFYSFVLHPREMDVMTTYLQKKKNILLFPFLRQTVWLKRNKVFVIPYLCILYIFINKLRKSRDQTSFILAITSLNPRPVVQMGNFVERNCIVFNDLKYKTDCLRSQKS